MLVSWSPFKAYKIYYDPFGVCLLKHFISCIGELLVWRRSVLVACTQAQLLMILTIQGALNSGRGCTGLTLIQLGLGATIKVSSGKSSCLEPVIRGNIHDANSRLVMAEQYR